MPKKMGAKVYKGFTIEHTGYMGPKPIAGIFKGSKKINETWGDGDSWTDSVWAAKDIIDDFISEKVVGLKEVVDLVTEHEDIGLQMSNLHEKYGGWFDWSTADQRAYEKLQKRTWQLNRDLKAMGFKTWSAAYKMVRKA